MSIQFEFRAPEPQTPEQQLAQDISLVMQAAIEQYHAGEIADAETLFVAILESMPHHPDANYNLGVIKVQNSRAVEAITHFEVALGSIPNNGQYWVAYINALFEIDQIAAGWTAVEIAQQQGVRGPAHDGLIPHSSRNPQTRLRTTPVAPANAAQEINLIVGEVAQPAEPAPDKAATLPKSIKYRQPTPSEINKHSSLVQKGQLGEALAYARRLVKNYPQSGDCWRSLTISLHKDGQFQEVIKTAKTAIEYNPSDTICRLLLADTLCYIGALTEAEVQCRELVALVLDHAEAHRVLAVTLGSLGRRAEALASLLRSSELAPRAAAVHSSLGTLYLGMGAMVQAEKSLRISPDIDPTDANKRSNLLFCLAHSRTIDKATLIKEHRAFGELHDVSAPAGGRRYGNDRNPERKLRVGFVSGDCVITRWLTTCCRSSRI
ncbi:MAG: Predicted O-linked N-acetylglucosamine transferase, SPINDLY family [uncultured Paraburkholderia sp.]|nr:MAG: Predicted O-linked N-acetylglucosamine transferase, SPINDLY family [uncultured Paraburkholderia sp.]CAH2918055.1 MAG: Predicted O-linked N-acetylglucosamine transferase, SPINDLY family [uncultured Paraburkholderia sp.]